MKKVSVDLSVNSGQDRSYAIFIDASGTAAMRLAVLLGELTNKSRILIVTDDRVAKLHLDRFLDRLSRESRSVSCSIIPEGEAGKSLMTLEALTTEWTKIGADRHALVVAIGGGAVGDIAGFAASIYLRGIDFVQVPTTLLAQLDASIGGKTAANLSSGKNLIGTFHQPKLVLMDLQTLQTLDERDLASGLAELVKHAAIQDAELFKQVENSAQRLLHTPLDLDLYADLIERSCRIKAKIVAADERETAPAGRILLNFGHTLGHAIETESHQLGKPLRHGEAVALGMVAAARLSVKQGLTGVATMHRLVAILNALKLPVDIDPWLTQQTFARLRVDKKMAFDQVKWVLLTDIGQARVVKLDLKESEKILLDGLSGC